VLTEGQVNEGIRVDWEHAKARRAARGGVGDPGDFKGVEWRFAERYERKWDALPETTSGWLFILSRPFSQCGCRFLDRRRNALALRGTKANTRWLTMHQVPRLP
jgi:hypothetical protein